MIFHAIQISCRLIYETEVKDAKMTLAKTGCLAFLGLKPIIHSSFYPLAKANGNVFFTQNQD